MNKYMKRNRELLLIKILIFIIIISFLIIVYLVKAIDRKEEVNVGYLVKAMNKKEELNGSYFTNVMGTISLINKRKALNNWLGKYGYSETYPHNSGDMYYVVDYEITIYEDRGIYYAELTGSGWFLSTRSLAYVEGDRNSIDIIFKQTLPGDSLYGEMERYEKDDLLITLTYNNSELYSLWYELQQEHPFLCDSEELMKGAYFIKLK